MPQGFVIIARDRSDQRLVLPEIGLTPQGLVLPYSPGIASFQRNWLLFFKDRLCFPCSGRIPQGLVLFSRNCLILQVLILLPGRGPQGSVLSLRDWSYPPRICLTASGLVLFPKDWFYSLWIGHFPNGVAVFPRDSSYFTGIGPIPQEWVIFSRIGCTPKGLVLLSRDLSYSQGFVLLPKEIGRTPRD